VAPPLSGGAGYKLSKNSRFGRKNKGLLKVSAKQEHAAQSTDGSITAQSEMTMIGLLSNPTKADFSPEGLLPHESAMQPRTRSAPAPSPALRPAHAPEAPSQRLDGRRHRLPRTQAACSRRTGLAIASLNNKRIYRGPIDDASKEPRGCASGDASSSPEQAIASRQFPTSAFQTKEI
jgi:hypothetical protein